MRSLQKGIQLFEAVVFMEDQPGLQPAEPNPRTLSGAYYPEKKSNK